MAVRSLRLWASLIVFVVVLGIGWSMSTAATINAGNGNDDVVGTADADEIDAGNGNDFVRALAGRDIVWGGNGNDDLGGDAGDDELFGENGNDALDGGAGSDTGWGGNGNDSFLGGEGHDWFDGDNGNDTSDGGPGLDVLFADHGNDVALGRGGADVLAMLAAGGTPALDGGAGDDVIVSARGAIRGGSDDDILVGSGQASIDGGSGFDVCYRTSGVDVVGCEQIIQLGSSNQTAGLVLTSAPADRSVVTTSDVTIGFAATNARGVMCADSTGQLSDCSTGSFTTGDLTEGSNAVAVIAFSDGSKPPAVQMRRFDVDAPAAPPAIQSAESPSVDTLVLATSALAPVAKVRAVFADGGAAVWPLDDPRVAIDPPAGIGTSQVTIVDPNLGAERVVRVELRSAANAVLAGRDVDVEVASSVVLDDAASPAPSTLTITGTGFAVLDRIRLLHAGGALDVLASDPGVVVTDEQIQIAGAALDGLEISQIDAIIALDGLEVVASLQVDITISASDQSPPAIETPGDLEIEAESAGGAQVDFSVSAFDDVDGPVSVTCDPASGSEFALGETIVTCTAVDAAGNEAGTTFIVRVVDTSAPQLTLPTTMIVDAVDAAGAAVDYMVTAIDNVDGDRPVACSPTSGSVFGIGTTIVECSAEDTRGNAATSTFMVVVRDVTAPVVSIEGAPIAEVTDAAGSPVEFTFTVRGVDDVDGPLDAGCTPAAGTILAPGTYEVRCTSTDAYGNVGSIEFNMEVVLVNAFTRAQDRIEEFLPEVLEIGYSSNLPMGVQVEAVDESTIIMDVDDGVGGLQRIWSEGQFMVRKGGVLEPIDTSLESISGGFAPRAVEYEAILPIRYADGISWTLADDMGVVRAYPVNIATTAPDGQVLASHPDRVMYPSVWPRTDLVATALGRGIKEHLVVTHPDAPSEFAWQLDLPNGATLALDDDGVIIEQAAERTVVAELPHAFDANGMIVPAWYEIDGSRLTLRWQPTVDDGAGPQPAAFPIAIDPSYLRREHTLEYTDLPDPAKTSDGNGVGATCFGNRLRITFQGLVGRTFFGSPGNFASAACELPGPPEGAEWYSLFGPFEWSIKDGQSIRLTDEAAPPSSPEIAGDRSLANFTSGVAGRQTGTAMIAWNAANDGPPEGDVRWQMRQTISASLNGETRFADFEPTRSFVDDTEPELVAIAPNVDGMIVREGPRTVSVAATDNGFGCRGGSGSVGIYEDGGEAPVAAWPVVDCTFAIVYDFAPATEYEIKFVVTDGLGTALEDSITFATPDPIYDPATGDVVGGKYPVELEVAEDFEPGSAQLWGTSLATGASFPIGTAVGGGAHTIEWDTLELANGAVRLELVYEPAVGPARVLESANVEVTNSRPLMTSSLANAAQTDVGGGMSVLHQTGALNAQYTDVSQAGWQGVQFGVTRSYNNQDLTGGLLGVGWRMSFEQRLRIGPDHVAWYVDSTGREWPFNPSAPGVYQPALGQTGQLRSNPDPIELVDAPWQIVYPDGRALTFAADGRLARETWPAGHSIHYSAPAPVAGGGYDIVITDDAFHAVTIRVGADNRAQYVEDSLGNRTEYGYDGRQRLSTVTNPVGDVTHRFEYEELPAFEGDLREGALLSIVDTPQSSYMFTTRERPGEWDETFAEVAVATDPSSNDRTFDYESSEIGDVEVRFEDRVEATVMDELGQVVEFVDAAGESTLSEYNSLGQVTATEDPLGDTTRTSYDSLGRVTSEIDAEENETRYEDHDAFGNPRTIIDAENNVSTATFDSLGRKTSESTPLGETTMWQYDGTSALPSSMDPPAGATLQFEYSDTGQVTRKYWIDDQSNEHQLEQAIYDDAGKPMSERRGELPATHYEYDTAGRQTAVIDPAGNRTETEYNPDGSIARTINPDGYEHTYEYDEHGRVYQETPYDGFYTQRSYDAFGNVVSNTDARGNVTETTYDELDNPRSETDPLGRETQYEYDAAGNLEREIDPAGFVTTTTYDGNGNELEITEPGPVTSSTTFTQLDNPHVETNGRGFSTTYGYDSLGRETSVTNAEGEISRTGYDAAGRIEWVENGLDERTNYTLDPAGNLVRTDNADGTFNLAEWTDAGLQSSRTDERGLTTALSYDDLGRVLSEQRPDGTVVSFTYDWAGRKLTETDAAGNVTSWSYDEMGRVQDVTYPDGRFVDYSYDMVGNLQDLNDSVTGTTTYEYDEANQRVAMITPSGDRTEYEYDVRGLLEREVAPEKSTEYVYDARRNLVRVESGSSVSTYTHDENGNVLVHTLADGSTITYAYDRVDRKISEVHSLRGETNWTWDPVGRIRTETTAAGTTTYHYDERGRVVRIEYPGGLEALFAYDGAGNLLSVTDWAGIRTFTRDAGGRVEQFTTLQGKPGSYTYDTAGRVVAMTYVNLRNVTINRTWTYDDQGRLIAFNPGNGSITYEYDGAGRVVAKNFPDGVRESVVYDDAGRVAIRTLEGHSELTYTYDGQDRVTLITSYNFEDGTRAPLHRYSYTPGGQLESWWYLDDAYRTRYVYDAAGNLKSMSRMLGAAPVGQNTAYENSILDECFEPNGYAACQTNYRQAISSLADPVPLQVDPRTLNTTYRAQVARYMLEHEMPMRTYQHDAQGRMVSFQSFNLSPSGNVFAYDSRGNQGSSLPTQGTEYNHANRPTRMYNTTQDVRVVWTHDGKLVSTTHLLNGSTQPNAIYDYTPDGQVLGRREVFASQITVQDYAYDPQGLVAVHLHRNTGSTTRTLYPHFNHRGDAITYHSKRGTDPIQYEDIHHTPWGEVDQSTTWAAYNILPIYGAQHGTLPLFTYANTGQDYWMGARTYNAIHARFKQIDPLPGQDALTDTAYSYASNDPVNRIDPDGEKSLSPDWVQLDGSLLREVASRSRERWQVHGRRVAVATGRDDEQPCITRESATGIVQFYENFYASVSVSCRSGHQLDRGWVRVCTWIALASGPRQWLHKNRLCEPVNGGKKFVINSAFVGAAVHRGPLAHRAGNCFRSKAEWNWKSGSSKRNSWNKRLFQSFDTRDGVPVPPPVSCPPI